MPEGASFELTPEQEEARRKAQEEQVKANPGRLPLTERAIKNPTDNPNMDPDGVTMSFSSAEDADRAARNALLDAQAQNAGVQRVDVQQNAGGIAGVFGGKEYGNSYTAGVINNNNAAGNAAAIDSRIAGVDARRPQTMGATIAGNASVDQRVADQSRVLAGGARNAQQNFLQSLEMSAAGKGGPSAAEATLQKGLDASIASNLALARSGRGGNQSVAMKQALQQNALATGAVSNDAAALRAREQQQAQQLYGTTASGIRAQDQQQQVTDLGAATTDAQLEQQTILANQALRNDASKTNLLTALDQQKQKDTMILQLMQMGMTQEQAAFEAEVQQQQFNAGLLAQQEAARQGVAIQNNASSMQTGAAIAQGVGTAISMAAAASDERVKTEITDGSGSLHEFLSALGTHEYEYDEPEKPLRGKGRFVSPMAQEIESTKLGKNMVKDTPDGKIVDYGKGFGTMLAALADQHKRLQRIEEMA